jgi:hypothetical protein
MKLKYKIKMSIENKIVTITLSSKVIKEKESSKQNNRNKVKAVFA